MIRETESVMPRLKETEFYERGHAIYKSLYPALQPVFGEIQNLAE